MTPEETDAELFDRRDKGRAAIRKALDEAHAAGVEQGRREMQELAANAAMSLIPFGGTDVFASVSKVAAAIRAMK